VLSDKIAAEFLELSSEQRLGIIQMLKTKKSKLSEIAKKLDSTNSEAHRNLSRLTKAQIISKDGDGNYHLTAYGNMLCLMIPSLRFFGDNKKFFSNHGFGSLPANYIQAIGSLADSKRISGYVRVMECWKNIYQNATKYIYNILNEVSYDSETINIVKDKLKSGMAINTVFIENAVISDNRKDILENTELGKLIKNSHLERRFSKDASIVMVLNEKQSSVAFPTTDGKIDISEVFYSDSPEFHDWCLSLFRHNWEHSTAFFDEKLKNQSGEHSNHI